MFQRISAGWELAKQSVQVLRLDKELLLFPVLSGIACSLVLISFAVPIVWSGALQGIEDDPQGMAQNVVAYLILFAFYFVNYFVIIFFNSALVGCAIIRLKGGNPNLGDGLGAAMERLPQIAGWAAVAATVGLILKIIESRSERVGQIVAGLLGMAWSITTFFVVPVIVVEKAGPFTAIQRSVDILKRSWGESLVANFSIGLFTFLLSLLAIIPIGAGVLLLGNQSIVLGLILLAIGVIWILAVSLISSALGSIILAALYIYASEGKVPQGFDSHLIQGAFGHK